MGNTPCRQSGNKFSQPRKGNRHMTATSVSELLDCVDELSLTTEKGGSGRTGLTVYP